MSKGKWITQSELIQAAIRILRARRVVTRKELAFEMGMQASSISGFLQGKSILHDLLGIRDNGDAAEIYERRRTLLLKEAMRPHCVWYVLVEVRKAPFRHGRARNGVHILQ